MLTEHRFINLRLVIKIKGLRLLWRNLRLGKYRFLVWVAYVVHGTIADLYYNTSNFEEILLAARQNHTGSTDRRDAFRGEKEAEVYDNPELTSSTTRSTAVNRIEVEMERPLAKFKFISHDIVKFLSDVLRQRASGARQFPLVEGFGRRKHPNGIRRRIQS